MLFYFICHKKQLETYLNTMELKPLQTKKYTVGSLLIREFDIITINDIT